MTMWPRNNNKSQSIIISHLLCNLLLIQDYRMIRFCSFLHTYPSILGHLSIHSWTPIHPFLHTYPSILAQLPIHSCTPIHPFLYNYPSILAHLSIHSWTPIHPFLLIFHSRACQATMAA